MRRRSWPRRRPRSRPAEAQIADALAAAEARAAAALAAAVVEDARALEGDPGDVLAADDGRGDGPEAAEPEAPVGGSTPAEEPEPAVEPDPAPIDDSEPAQAAEPEAEPDPEPAPDPAAVAGAVELVADDVGWDALEAAVDAGESSEPEQLALAPEDTADDPDVPTEEDATPSADAPDAVPTLPAPGAADVGRLARGAAFSTDSSEPLLRAGAGRRGAVGRVARRSAVTHPSRQPGAAASPRRTPSSARSAQPLPPVLIDPLAERKRRRKTALAPPPRLIQPRVTRLGAIAVRRGARAPPHLPHVHRHLPAPATSTCRSRRRGVGFRGRRGQSASACSGPKRGRKDDDDQDADHAAPPDERSRLGARPRRRQGDAQEVRRKIGYVFGGDKGLYRPPVRAGQPALLR